MMGEVGMNEARGLLFEEAFQKELKEKFYYADNDPDHGERLFFDKPNSEQPKGEEAARYLNWKEVRKDP